MSEIQCVFHKVRCCLLLCHHHLPNEYVTTSRISIRALAIVLSSEQLLCLPSPFGPSQTYGPNAIQCTQANVVEQFYI